MKGKFFAALAAGTLVAALAATPAHAVCTVDLRGTQYSGRDECTSSDGVVVDVAVAVGPVDVEIWCNNVLVVTQRLQTGSERRWIWAPNPCPSARLVLISRLYDSIGAYAQGIID